MTVRMNNADGDPLVERLELDELEELFIESEPKPKPRTRGNIFDTSDKQRVSIPPCSPLVRSHATVLFSAGDNVIRQRALDELKRLMNDEDDNGAVEVLKAFDAWKKA